MAIVARVGDRDMAKKDVPEENWTAAALSEAEALGLLNDSSLVDISERLPGKLLQAAKERAGLRSNKQVIMVALAVSAGRDNFGEELLKLQGSIDPSIDLEF